MTSQEEYKFVWSKLTKKKENTKINNEQLIFILNKIKTSDVNLANNLQIK